MNIFYIFKHNYQGQFLKIWQISNHRIKWGPWCKLKIDLFDKDTVRVCTHTHTHTHTQSRILFSSEKEGNPAICDSVNGNGGYYVKWNIRKKTNTAWYHLYVESKKPELIKTETNVVVTRGWKVGEMGTCWSKCTNFLLEDK